MNILKYILVLLFILTASVALAGNNGNQSDIIFSHPNHTDLECGDCHSGAITSDKSSDKLFPEMELCGECHDIDDDNECGTCHRNPDEPSASPNPIRELAFNHKRHIGKNLTCQYCHGDMSVGSGSQNNNLPGKPACMKCHDGQIADNNCSFCHLNGLSLIDVHPNDWRHQHAEEATAEPEWCQSCHAENSFCIACHRGDNPTGLIHDLNFKYTHGLEAGTNEFSCTACHDNRTFCVDCHESENRMPLRHSTINWLFDHGQTARENVENCAACHDNADPTCSRSGCHRDSDGLRGTDPGIHVDDISLFDSKGPWHSDGGYYCFQCHADSRNSGFGFCNYCHGTED
ncbi:MAG: hypothetical protein ABIJ45_15340 [Candidatus Zixiibacteriota bacterium]